MYQCKYSRNYWRSCDKWGSTDINRSYTQQKHIEFVKLLRQLALSIPPTPVHLYLGNPKLISLI